MAFRHDDPSLELLDAATHEAASRSRAARRDLAARAAELATWRGTLHDLAEARRPLALQLRDGRRHDGHLRAVALDHVILAARNGTTVLVPLGAVAAIHLSPEAVPRAASGDREQPQDRTLLEALVDLLEVDAEVAVGVGTTPITGHVVGAGEDVLTLRTAGGGTVVVPTVAVTDVVWGLR